MAGVLLYCIMYDRPIIINTYAIMRYSLRLLANASSRTLPYRKRWNTGDQCITN